MNNILFKVNVNFGARSYGIKQVSHHARKQMVWNIGPVNEHEAQSAIISLFDVIIRKEYKLRQQCHLIFLVGVLQQRKEADFNRRQSVLLRLYFGANTGSK
jgi:hypothetical protein